MFESNLWAGHRFDPHSRKTVTLCDYPWVTAPDKCLKYKTMAENEHNLQYQKAHTLISRQTRGFQVKKIFFLLLTLVNMKIITFPVKGVLLQKSNYVFTQILLYCRGSKMNYFELIIIIVRSMMLMWVNIHSSSLWTHKH